MIQIMDLRPGNYIQAGEEGRERRLRVIALDLVQKTILAKEDHLTEIETFQAGMLQGCPLEALAGIIGGLSFDGHSLLIKGAGEVFIVHEEGPSINLPHIRYVHQFQNLFRSLTGQELPFNLS